MHFLVSSATFIWVFCSYTMPKCKGYWWFQYAFPYFIRLDYVLDHGIWQTPLGAPEKLVQWYDKLPSRLPSKRLYESPSIASWAQLHAAVIVSLLYAGPDSSASASIELLVSRRYWVNNCLCAVSPGRWNTFQLFFGTMPGPVLKETRHFACDHSYKYVAPQGCQACCGCEDSKPSLCSWRDLDGVHDTKRMWLFLHTHGSKWPFQHIAKHVSCVILATQYQT